jgi:hypothetical protein
MPCLAHFAPRASQTIRAGVIIETTIAIKCCRATKKASPTGGFSFKPYIKSGFCNLVSPLYFIHYKQKEDSNKA